MPNKYLLGANITECNLQNQRKIIHGFYLHFLKNVYFLEKNKDNTDIRNNKNSTLLRDSTA